MKMMFFSLFIVSGVGLMFDFYCTVMSPITISKKWCSLMRRHEKLHLQLIDDNIQTIVEKIGRPFYAFFLQVLSHYTATVLDNELFTISLFLNSYGLSTRGMNMLARFDRCLTDRSFRRIRKKYYLELDKTYRYIHFEM